MTEVLLRRTLDLWPEKARTILDEKEISIPKLTRQFKRIIFPWNVNYDQQRMLFSTQIQERPLFIIQAENSSDVRRALKTVHHYGLSLRVLGGRHSPLPGDPEVFLDLSRLRKIKLSDKILRVQAGATQGEVNHYLFQRGLCLPTGHANHPSSAAFPGGSAITVGAGGITMAGGIGTLRRTLGLAIDSAIGFTIVVQRSGEYRKITANAEINTDLFWALRGGGPYFGVLLEINFSVKLIPSVMTYSVTWKWDQATDVLREWSHSSLKRSNSFNEDLALSSDMSGTKAIDLSGVYVLRSQESINDAYDTITRELEKLPHGKIKISSKKSYAEIYTQLAVDRVYHSYSVGKTVFTNQDITTDFADTIVTFVDQWSQLGSRFYLGFQLMGGRISKVKSNETAFYPRQAKFFLDIFNFWDSISDTKINYKWNNQLFELLYEKLGPYTYIGFPIEGLPSRAYFGPNLPRLIQIKERYDPNNFMGKLITE